MQIKLVIAVNEIERGTSPFAIDENIFEVAPPGTAAIIITPTANSGGKLGNKKIIMKKATSGKIIICEVSPTKTSFGWIKILVKSLIFKPKPKENIIKAMAIVNRSVVNSILNITTRFLYFLKKLNKNCKI